MIGLWQAHNLSSTNYTVEHIFCGYLKDGKELDKKDCDTLMNLDVISSTGGRFYKEIHEELRPITDERLLEIKDNAFARWQDKLSGEQNKDLNAEQIKLEKWANEEIENLKLAHAGLEAEYKSLKASQDNVSSFADKFKINKALADLDKRRRAENDKKDELAKIIKHKKDALVEGRSAEKVRGQALGT